MKTHLLVFGVLANFCSDAFCQLTAETDLYETLIMGPGSVAALQTVLKKADGYSALILYGGAAAAFKEKRLEDSGFLFYTAQLRARFDKECFPPKGKGGDSPFLVYAGLS